MKLLENAALDGLSSILTMETPICDMTTRVESYSCKMAGDPKKLYKQLRNEHGTSPHDLEILGPSLTRSVSQSYAFFNSPSTSFARSISSDDESPLLKTIPRKTLIFLISTLNASFQPDYEFSSCTSQDFSRENNFESVKNLVDTRFVSVMADQYRSILNQFWTAIDEEINLKESEIFSYRPDGKSDPFSESGIIWSFNFFFYNRKLRRILFLTCRTDCKTSFDESEDRSRGDIDYNGYSTFEGVMD